MIICAIVAFSQYKTSGAIFLGIVFLVTGLILPLSFFKNILDAIEKQIVFLKISEKRYVYTIDINSEGINIKLEKENLYFLWKNVYAIYSYKDNLYIYVNENQAFIILKEQCNMEQLQLFLVQNTNINVNKY
ncbi:MAG: YcxB family protein [Anaerotignaceae bacterium]